MLVGVGLSGGAGFLTDAGQAFLKERYAEPPMIFGKQLDANLDWAPAIQVVVHENLTVLVEPSEDRVYPMIFRLRHAEVLDIQRPIAIYAICPEEVALRADQQADIRLLEQHGYGLLVVNRVGDVSVRTVAVPLIQLISKPEYKEEVRGLRGKLVRRVAQAFDAYQHRPTLGLVELSEIAEGMVMKAGKEAVSKGWVTAGKVKDPAGALDELSVCKNCQNARAALGGMRSYMTEYRNVSHHYPKNKRKAYLKYRECRHGFLDGIKHIRRFREAMKGCGLSGKLP